MRVPLTPCIIDPRWPHCRRTDFSWLIFTFYVSFYGGPRATELLVYNDVVWLHLARHLRGFVCFAFCWKLCKWDVPFCHPESRTYHGGGLGARLHCFCCYKMAHIYNRQWYSRKVDKGSTTVAANKATHSNFMNWIASDSMRSVPNALCAMIWRARSGRDAWRKYTVNTLYKYNNVTEMRLPRQLLLYFILLSNFSLRFATHETMGDILICFTCWQVWWSRKSCFFFRLIYSIRHSQITWLSTGKRIFNIVWVDTEINITTSQTVSL